MSRHPSVVELVRCLAVLKATEPLWHDHLKAYHGAEWGIRVRWATVKRKRGKTESVKHYDRVRRVPGWVKTGYVRLGEQRLCELFVGAARLPEELEDALVLSSVEIEEKWRRKKARRAAREAA